MKKRTFLYLLFVVFVSLQGYSQTLSSSQKKELIKQYDKQIKDLAEISSDKVDLLPVYQYRVNKANDFINEKAVYNTDNEVYAKYLELKTLLNHNKELLEFLTPRSSELYYVKALNLISQNKKSEGYSLLQKSISLNPKNVMAHYELAKLSSDSAQIIKTTQILNDILSKMNPTAEEKKLCANMLVYTYDKNLLQSIALIKEKKYAYAYDILTQLDDFCKKDNMNICQSALVKKNIEACHQGIYNDHITITKRAIKMGEMKIASDFAENTYDYLQRNRVELNDTSSFDEIVTKVVDYYIATAKTLQGAKNSELRGDMLAKARTLSEMVGGKFEENTLRQIALLQGTLIPSDTKLDSIENNAKPEGYSLDYADYIKDTVSNPEEEVTKIEKDYISSSENKNPKESFAVQSTKVKTIDKAIDDKFFETRTFMQVNNYEKALEVLEKANRLAKIEGDKKAVEQMYIRAIREITAKRMSNAEYAIFEGDIPKADSLVALTNDLITEYKMEEDTAIQRIMNSYLRAIDNKVCSKKQDEINVLVYDILECIRKNDFYTAEVYIDKAMEIKGNSECRLDKQRVRSLKRQIEEPLQYVAMKENCEQILSDKDTIKYFLEYAKLEYYYNTHKLNEMSVIHTGLREVLKEMNNDDLAIKIAESLIKYQQYEGAIEAIGSLKLMGYKAKHTKKIQKRIGQLMSMQEAKRQDKIAQNYRMEDKYNNDKWFKYFLKSYKKNFIKYQRMKF
ncbi:MAG: hypothetical protein SPL98_02140 [Bacteroidales bacterium]|nr:hypothetical protein [Bacteroidales bacterium]MDY6402781.1 hypothetical protein [Bacteroidales bacterium]